jgi:Sec-independent protein secretion pathway component TatC
MKDKLKNMLSSFFISVTLINIAMLVLGRLLRPDQQFGYEVFMYPLIYGLIGMIPALIVRDGKELTVRQTLIREAIRMVLTVVLLVAFIFGGNPIEKDIVITAVCVAVSVVIIYVGVVVIGWFLDKKTADQLTEDLIRFQEKQQNL